MIDNELIDLLPTLPLIENPEDINESTRLVQDLHLYDYEAKMFVFKYSEKYNVDISKFRFNKYFSKSSVYDRLFNKYFRKKEKTLTLGDLQKAIKYKHLNEKVLEDITSKEPNKEGRKAIKFYNQPYHVSKKDNIIYTIIFFILILLLGITALIF